MEKGFKVLQVVSRDSLWAPSVPLADKKITPQDKDGKMPAIEKQKIPSASAKDKGERLPK